MVYIQKRWGSKSERQSYDCPDDEWGSILYPRLYKKFKGNIVDMITYLYKNRDRYDTYLHRIFYEFFVKIPGYTYNIKDSFVPLFELMEEHASIHIDLVYKEMLQHQDLVRGDVRVAVNELKPSRLLLFLWGIMRHVHKVRGRPELYIKAKEFLAIAVQNRTVENIKNLFNNIGYLDTTQIMQLINEVPETHREVLCESSQSCFHLTSEEVNPRTGLSWARSIVWTYDLEVIWEKSLFVIGNDDDSVFDNGGVLLEYYLLKNPERMEIFENILHGTRARPSEMVQFFKTGALPGGVNPPSEEEALLF